MGGLIMSNDEEVNKLDQEKYVSDRLVTLIGILFSVVIGRSLIDFRMDLLLLDYNVLRLFALFIIYSSIVCSWYGYHKTINLYHYRSSIWGHARFLSDILIVVWYTILIYSVGLLGVQEYGGQTINRYDGMLRITFLYIIIFIFYIVQGIFKRKSHNNKRASNLKLSMIFTFLHFILFTGYFVESRLRLFSKYISADLQTWFQNYVGFDLQTLLDGLFLVIIFIFLLLYRFLRHRSGYPIRERVEDE